MKPALSRQMLLQIQFLLDAHADRLAEKLAKALNGTAQSGAIHPGKAPRPGDKFCSTYQELAEATGISSWSLKAMRAFTRNSPDNPFCGQGGYPSEIQRWLCAHRDWKASQAWPRAKGTANEGEAAEGDGPAVTQGERFCRGDYLLAEALGITMRDLTALKRYASTAPGTPFMSSGAYPSGVKSWVKDLSDAPPHIENMKAKLGLAA